VNEAASINYSAAGKAFDRVAGTYDEVFTYSAIGQAQRKQVWERLLEVFAPGERVLELNCGTGEDARFLAERGRRIVACDASAAMIEVAETRRKREEGGGEITFLRLANEELASLPLERPFDGAYSNFSGLNCVQDLGPIARALASLVRPGGHVVMCLWSRVCAWEVAWYLVRGEGKKAFRRLSGKSTARVGGVRIEIWYHAVRELQRAFAPSFPLERRRAVGLFVPPSYAERWARGHERTLRAFEGWDGVFAGLPILRDLGDHVLLEFTRCNP
jgi:ubiquinone/menaquinone biosynthesis C-methylase UbiE